MTSLDMSGPFKFDAETIGQVIHDNKIGNYALGKAKDGGGLSIAYIGRSDTDLKTELLARLKTHPQSDFKASYALSAKEAYQKECQNYHDFSPPENNIHPASPQNSNLKCHICGK